MSKYSNYSTKQLLTILENLGFSHRNGNLYDDEVINIISYLDENDTVYVHTIKTYNRFYDVYSFLRIRHDNEVWQKGGGSFAD